MNCFSHSLHYAGHHPENMKMVFSEQNYTDFHSKRFLTSVLFCPPSARLPKHALCGGQAEMLRRTGAIQWLNLKAEVKNGFCLCAFLAPILLLFHKNSL
jgi:hypothetical protein